MRERREGYRMEIERSRGERGETGDGGRQRKVG